MSVVMGEAALSDAEIIERFNRFCAGSLQTVVNARENQGKFLTLDVVTGDYQVGDNYMENVRRVKARHPAGLTCSIRIGSPELFPKGYRNRLAADGQ